jgi:hypothetical protein
MLFSNKSHWIDIDGNIGIYDTENDNYIVYWKNGLESRYDNPSFYKNSGKVLAELIMDRYIKERINQE